VIWWATTVATGALSATDDSVAAVEDAELSLICVGTPSSPTGMTDLQFVLRAAADIGDALRGARGSARNCHAVVVRSTVPPGTTDEFVGPAVLDALERAGTRLSAWACAPSSFGKDGDRPISTPHP